eukprot:m.6623 g.6623  ORF g.6623 m.6623 type:complete len:486 (+) comp16434_c0_seq1:100-1557(+)
MAELTIPLATDHRPSPNFVAGRPSDAFCVTGPELAKLVSSEPALSNSASESTLMKSIAWERFTRDGSVTTSLKGVLHQNSFVTFCNKRVQSFPIRDEQNVYFVPFQSNANTQVHDREAIARHVEGALQQREEPPYDNDEEFVEAMCINPMFDGATIAVDIPFQLKQYGIVVKDLGSENSFHVIYCPRVPSFGLLKLPYSEFTRNAKNVTLWKPPDAELKRHSLGCKLRPPADIAQLAIFAHTFGTVTFKDRALGDLEWLCPSERFVFQLSALRDDWQLVESDINERHLVKVYSPSRELEPTDMVCALGNGHIHGGVVYSVSDDQVFIGHFRRARRDRSIGLSWKSFCEGDPMLTAIDVFLLKSDSLYKSVGKKKPKWSVPEIQERIRLSVEGKLLPIGVPSAKVPLSKECQLVQMAPGTERLTPSFHEVLWNCGLWAKWIKTGESIGGKISVLYELKEPFLNFRVWLRLCWWFSRRPCKTVVITL